MSAHSFVSLVRCQAPPPCTLTSAAFIVQSDILESGPALAALPSLTCRGLEKSSRPGEAENKQGTRGQEREGSYLYSCRPRTDLYQ